MDFSGRERNRLFIQEPESFREAGFLAGADLVTDGRQVATADFDRDGATDLIIASRNSPRLTILRGTPAGSWISVRVEGDRAHRPRDAVGATVRAERCGVTSRHLVSLTDGFGAQSTRELTIGLADCPAVDSLEVVWPDGHTRRFEKLAAGHRYRLRPSGDATALTLSNSEEAGGAALSWLLPTLAGVGDGDGGAVWTYVALTASWCEACKRAIPAQESLARAVAPHIRTVYVSVEESDDADKLSAADASRIVPTIALPAAEQKKLAARLRDTLGGTPPLPSGLLLDQRGNIRWRGTGVPDPDTLLAVAGPAAATPAQPSRTDAPHHGPQNGLDWWWLVIAAIAGGVLSAFAVRRRAGPQ